MLSSHSDGTKIGIKMKNSIGEFAVFNIRAYRIRMDPLIVSLITEVARLDEPARKF